MKTTLNTPMKKKKYLSLAILGICTLAFGGSLVMYISNTMQPTTVYIYTTDVNELNTPANNSQFMQVQIPVSAVSEDFITSLDGIEDLSFTTKVFKGQYAYKSQLATADKLDVFDEMDLSKMRRVSLPINYVEGLAGNIKRGDKIDLIFSSTGTKTDENGMSGNGTYAYGKTVLQDIYVESVSTGDGYKFIDKSKVTSNHASVDQASGDIGVITLAVSLEQAEEIKARQQVGTLSVVGRFDESISYETLGYVVGDYSKVFSGAANAETGKVSVPLKK